VCALPDYSTTAPTTDFAFTFQRTLPEIGIYDYRARFYDPLLGRFLSPDTIIPEQSQGVQAWDRYAYVNNAPTRFTDPSGHLPIDDECGYQGQDCGSPLPTYPITISGGSSGSGSSSSSSNRGGRSSKNPGDELEDIVQKENNPIESYCGDTSGLGCLAMLAQDVATLVDLVGVGLIEGPAVAVGCIEGGPLGCAIAEVGVIATWNTTLNTAETAASSASLILTIADDLLNNGRWGENSSTSLATFVAGLAPLTPSWDVVVDGYSSGYNHGFFNGISTIWSNGLLK
jgi:RHS repeat-associated protein